MSNDLKFDQPPPSNGDILFDPVPDENISVGSDGKLSLVFWNKARSVSDLAFGAPDGQPLDVNITVTGTLPPLKKWTPDLPPTVQLSINATLPALKADIEVRPITPLTVVGVMPGLQVISEVQYLSNTQRPTIGKHDGSYQIASKLQSGVTMPEQDGTAKPVGWDAFWQKTIGQLEPIVHKLPDAFVPMPVPKAIKFEDAAPDSLTQSFYQQDADRDIRPTQSGSFQAAADIRGSTWFIHQDGDRTKRPSLKTSHQNAVKKSRNNSTDFQKAAAFKYWNSTRFQDAKRPPVGITVLPGENPGLVKYYDPNGDLLFSEQWQEYSTIAFLFKADGFTPPKEAISIPVQRVYIVLNNVNLRRVSDNYVIPTLSMSLSLDMASWTWGFDATVPGQFQAAVEPSTGPVELKASVNGTDFRVFVESISRERSFGQSSLRIAGRGRNAVLDAPYAPILSFQNTDERTANQLAEDALLYNGINVGGADPWTIQWGLTDWFVPANVFVHQGTHISALNTIAQAAGGYLQPHRTSNVLRILPKYPVAPWKWATDAVADYELPADITTRESIQWVDKPNYNRVFVSGQQSGVLGQVTKQGTAGDEVAQMVTDALITHADAARQRGISILSDTGRIATVGLSLPVISAVGVIEPGKFVRYVDGSESRLGLVRSTQVSVGANGTDTMQQIVLETHE